MDTGNEYQAFLSAGVTNALFLLNGSGETMSVLDTDSNSLYNRLQTVGQNQSSSAIPNDILITDDKVYVLLSGQNSVECYDVKTLDYKNRIYLKNGFNPLNFIPLSHGEYAFVTGYNKSEIVLINLETMTLASPFTAVFESLSLPGTGHSETSVPATPKNAPGENKRRGSTSGVSRTNGADSRLYVTNVRYDSTILLTDSSGNLVNYNGSNVRANGYFREGTLSIISFDNTDPSGSDPTLVREVDLDSLYRDATGTDDYFPGDGLNPQAVHLLDGRLHIVCTGTNGGEARNFTSGEYIPSGYSVGDTVPGTDPDDGIILILDITDPDNPQYLHHLPIGGSPSSFRESIDPIRKIVYSAGVGAIHAYRYGLIPGDFNVLRGNSNPVLKGANQTSDYYSHLIYDGAQEILYASFFSESQLLGIQVSGGADPSYSAPRIWRTGDGPGGLALWNNVP